MAPLARGRERRVVRRAGPQQLARRALLDDAAADDDDDAVALGGEVHLVQRQQHAALRRRVAPERGVEDVRGDADVERRQRVVGDEEVRPGVEGAAQAHARLLAAAQRDAALADLREVARGFPEIKVRAEAARVDAGLVARPVEGAAQQHVGPHRRGEHEGLLGRDGHGPAERARPLGPR